MNICIFGDSITWGSSDEQKGGWVERLKMHFLASEDENVRIYNLGIPNDDTEKLLNRFDIEASARKPDVIFFAIGINDSQYLRAPEQPRILLETFRLNLETLLKKAQEFASKVVFIGLTRVDEAQTMPVPWDESLFYANEQIEKYDTEIKKICEQNDLLFISTAQIINHSNLDDGLHPNANGHEKIFEKVLQVYPF